ncbi:DUF3047 domain-containing protein [Desulfogranum marinum]|uniref:DUF3047 domain-containing protein n=1 Tax=Desulfogranum marinum TaxID=453220 RepID=UPI001964C115|nr:DUF3047 domain-containing protein [Desulfogranum marinum]
MTSRFQCSLQLLLVWMLLFGCMATVHGKESVFFEESFTSLSRWKLFTFPGIPVSSEYRLTTEDAVPCLHMESDGGASALVFDQLFNVYEYPKLQWRWKVRNVYHKGDSTTKQGDDYPARLYVMFRYDAETASFAKQIQYGIAKLLYGEYPPDSSLNYIWANRVDARDIITNAYTDQAKMIPVSKGEKDLGSWQTYTVDIVADYRKAFRKEPPKEATVAVMIDADDTGETARACIDFIRIFR